MKACKIKGIANNESGAEKQADLYLCDFCFEYDKNRGGDAQILDYDEYISEENVCCDVCNVSVEIEKLEATYRK